MYETTKDDIIQAQQGNKSVLEKIIENNAGLVWSIVKRFSGRGYEVEELHQIGMIGFIKAIKRFDANFEVRLSTYAVPYILGEIKRFIRDDGPIKVSRSIKELAIKIKDIQNQTYKELGEELSISEVANKLKVSKEDVAFALDSLRPLESINEEAYDEGDTNGVTKIDKISNKKDETNSLIDKITLMQLINDLNKRDKEIILLRFFREKTQTEVANMLGISQVQVSRIEKKVLSGMKLKLIS